MKVLSYNIMSGGFNSYSSKTDIPQRIDLLKKVIADIDADFVGLIDTFRWKEVFTQSDLRKHFGYENVFCIDMDDTRVDKRVGLTVLSKFEMKCEMLRVHNRNCIKSTINGDERKYTIFTVYLDDLSEDTRLQEAESLLSQITRNNTIIIGDLNTFSKSDLKFLPKNLERYFHKVEPGLYKYLMGVLKEMKRGEVIELFQKAGFVNGMPTFRPTIPSKLFPGDFDSPIVRVDYVLHSKDVQINNAKVLISDILNKTSDHFPIYFEF